ncbi:MAG TPA: 4Fe-4S dicluster domain-containing protein, partial [Candidatus Methanoperedens sp.]|nr:4Fe-4S dicluster domain-containing protein [Candidatus Methanoperedens sp.]
MEEEKKIRKPRGIAKLIQGKCIACGARCQSDCPEDAIEMNDKGEPVINLDKCIGCRRCVKICPAQALEMYFTPEEQKILAQIASSSKGKEPQEPIIEEAGIKEYKNVWVFVEHTEGEPATVSWELLGAGAKLASSL